MDFLKDSWGSFAADTAKAYLRTFGSPAHTSMSLLMRILRDLCKAAPPHRLLDVGCGNASLYSRMMETGVPCDYMGIDFSAALLTAARALHPEAMFTEMDVQRLALPDRSFDYVVFSHVLEMLASPEKALQESKRVCRKKILIRFFEPPVFRCDETELRFMDVGMGKVPYLRRKMSKDYYDMMLANCGIRTVEVYKDSYSTDQIHVLDAA
jgi:ubiquinone/menaquinone biosynthesis C-methylase UbiE